MQLTPNPGDELPDFTSNEPRRPPPEEPVWTDEMAQLADRIDSVQEADVLLQRLEALDQAWVIVFEADTDDEAVYSMVVEGDGGGESQVVLAFENRIEAERYATSLDDEPYATPASVQALDLEALVVTSREASFRVAVVFAGDLQGMDDLLAAEGAAPSAPIFTGGEEAAAKALAVSITMVPETLFAGKTSADFIDPAEDPIWVLVQDAGTGDAQYFSMAINGSDSIVCFRDREAAERCGVALASKGVSRGVGAERVMLEDLLEGLDDERDVCLVDEVVETLLDDDDFDGDPPGLIASDEEDNIVGRAGGGLRGCSGPRDSSTSATPRHVLDSLERLFDAGEERPGGEDGPAAEEGPGGGSGAE